MKFNQANTGNTVAISKFFQTKLILLSHFRSQCLQFMKKKIVANRDENTAVSLNQQQMNPQRQHDEKAPTDFEKSADDKQGKT